MASWSIFTRSDTSSGAFFFLSQPGHRQTDAPFSRRALGVRVQIVPGFLPAVAGRGRASSWVHSPLHVDVGPIPSKKLFRSLSSHVAEHYGAALTTRLSGAPTQALAEISEEAAGAWNPSQDEGQT